MYFKLLILSLTLLLHFTKVQAQQSAYHPTVFTWEGALNGNKAVWKVNDTLNTYRNLDGVDVQVKLIDPLKLNTNTKSPSEFNDYTKTNTFFGNGSMALQIKSQKAKQAVCLEFTFSKPVILAKFNVFDIDMIQSALPNLSTYVDSLYFDGSNAGVNVPILVEKTNENSTLILNGQSVKALAIKGVNGDLSHTNTLGAVQISSNQPLITFRAWYANSSDDDGMSNSHAIRIPTFEFYELLGDIRGYVLEAGTNAPLEGSALYLYDESGKQAINKDGLLMQYFTGEDGYYEFNNLRLGKYTISQINPSGYESDSDTDGINDNQIQVTLTQTYKNSIDNNFYEIRSAPLPVQLVRFDGVRKADHSIRTSWTTVNEVNLTAYHLSIAEDGVDYREVGRVKVPNNSLEQKQYEYTFDPIKRGDLYVRLSQSDLDGTIKVLATKLIKDKFEDEALDIYPNPVNSVIFLDKSDKVETAIVTIFTASGKQVFKNESVDDQIDITSLPKGMFLMNVKVGQTTKVFKIVKE